MLVALVPLGCGGSDDKGSSNASQSTGSESTTQTNEGTTQSKGDGSQAKKDDKTKSTGGSEQPKGDTTQSTGGSSTPTKKKSTQSTPKASRKAFIAKADRVCNDYVRRTRDISDPGTDAAATARFYREVASAREKLYQSFASLPKPSGDQKVLTRYQTNVQKSASLGNQIADAIESNDAEKGPALIESATKLAAKNGKIAKAYGFRVCRG